MLCYTGEADGKHAGAFAKLQLLAPGESAAPGTSIGKTGTPSAQTAGTAFNVTVRAVDANWNLVSTNDTVAITSTDANATLPGNAAVRLTRTGWCCHREQVMRTRTQVLLLT